MDIISCPKCGCSEPRGFVKDGICLKRESEKFLGIKLWNAREEREFRKLCKQITGAYQRHLGGEMKKERFQSTLNLISENANELIEAMRKVNLGSVRGREYIGKTIKIVTERGEALEILRGRSWNEKDSTE